MEDLVLAVRGTPEGVVVLWHLGPAGELRLVAAPSWPKAVEVIELALQGPAPDQAPASSCSSS